jgi:hypothetical protein
MELFLERFSFVKFVTRIVLFPRQLFLRYPRISGVVCGAISLCFFLCLGMYARCYNHDSVFLPRGSSWDIYYVDGDCYSRMTRVRMVLEHPFTVIHHQDFENYPDGVSSHATAPFDYLIAFLAVLLKPLTLMKWFKFDYVDMAGAIVSPLLGAAMIVFLWDWSRRLKLPYREIMLLLVAISPIIVFGTVLGRPRHQSLQMLCMVVALGAEWCLAQKPSRGWGIAAGAAWGLGLWVSLYEPLVLMVMTVLLYLLFDRRKLWAPERRAGHIVFAAIMVLMLLIDGVPHLPHDELLLEYFPRWAQTIGELGHAGIYGLLEWGGYALLAAPALALLRYRKDKRMASLLVMLVAVCVLTAWQMRWGYFFGIVFAMSLPYLFAPLRKWWIVWPVFLLSLWPVYAECQAMRHPTQQRMDQLAEQERDVQALRVVSEYLKTGKPLPVLAPWWFCPEIAYWSGQPAVAGTSHESMPGIVDTSRFYITTDYEEAGKIVRERGVKCVIAYDSDRVLKNASTLLGERWDRDKSLAAVLYRAWHSAPPFLKFDIANQEFKIFEVVPEEPQQ